MMTPLTNKVYWPCMSLNIDVAGSLPFLLRLINGEKVPVARGDLIYVRSIPSALTSVS